jgi:hypothetical protein
MQTGAKSFWARLAGNPLMDVGAAGLLLLAAIQIAAELPRHFDQPDFSHYYAWGRALLEGASPYAGNLAPFYERNGFLFDLHTPYSTATPLFVWVFAAIAWMPPRLAFAACAAVQIASLAIILLLTRSLLAGRLSPRGWRFVCAGAVCTPAVYWHLCAGHLELLLAAMTLMAYRWHLAGKPLAACLTVTAAGLMKLFPLALLPWFLWRSATDWRGRARHLAWVVGFAAVVIGATGLTRWLEYSDAGVGVLREWMIRQKTFSYSVPSLIVTLNYLLHDMRPSAEALVVGWQVAQCAGLAVLGAAYLACWRWVDDELGFCLLIVAMMAASTLAWAYYFVFLIFPVTVAAMRTTARFTTRRLMAFTLILLLLNDLGTWSGGCGIHDARLLAILNTPPIFGLLGLGWFLLHELRAVSRRSPPEAAG